MGIFFLSLVKIFQLVWFEVILINGDNEMSSLSLYLLVLNILDGEKLLDLLPHKFISKQLLRNPQSQNTTYYAYNSNLVSIQNHYNILFV